MLSRSIAYHGTSMGALSITGLPAIKQDFEPLVPSTFRVPNTNYYRAPRTQSDDTAEAVRPCGPPTGSPRRSSSRGRTRSPRVFLEPVQNSGGCFPPPPGYFQRVREICDPYDVLLVSDEVICAFGRLGEYFGSRRYGYQPDIITCAKGLTSGYIPLGAMIASRPAGRAVPAGHQLVRPRHHLRRAPGRVPRSPWPTWTSSSARTSTGHVRANADVFRVYLERLSDLPIVGDVRGDGYFFGIELVKDKATKETFNDEESERLLRGFLSGRCSTPACTAAPTTGATR